MAATLKAHTASLARLLMALPGAQNLPSPASVALLFSPLSHLGSGNCVFTDRAPPRPQTPSKHSVKASDLCQRTLRHQLRRRFIFMGKDEECHSHLKSLASGDSANIQGDPWLLWFNIFHPVPQ